MNASNIEVRPDSYNDFFGRVDASNVDSIILRRGVLDIWEPEAGSLISRLCNRVVRFIKVLNGEFNDEKIARKIVDALKVMQPFPNVAIAVITNSERFKGFSVELDPHRISRISLAQKAIAFIPEPVDLEKPKNSSNSKYAINQETVNYIERQRPKSWFANRLFLGLDDLLMNEDEWNVYLNRLIFNGDEADRKFITSAALEAGNPKEQVLDDELLINTRNWLHRVSSRSLPPMVVEDLRGTFKEQMIID